jgi:hypothetical protein
MCRSSAAPAVAWFNRNGEAVEVKLGVEYLFAGEGEALDRSHGRVQSPAAALVSQLGFLDFCLLLT